MTTRTCRRILSVVALAVSLSCLGWIYRDHLKNWDRSFDNWRTDRAIRQCCVDLPAIDEVRLLHIESIGPSPSLGSYTTPLDPSEKMTVVAEKTLNGAEAQQLIKLWQKQMLHTEYMATCHEPHHVIQFRRSGNLVVEVVVCFMCQNVAIRRFPGWDLVSFADFPEYEFKPLQLLVESHVGAHIREKPPVRHSPE